MTVRGNAVPATPSGWTSTAWTGYNSTGSGPGNHVMFRAWQSGDTALSVTIFDGGGTGQTVMAYIVRVTGADLTDPFGYTSGSQRVNSAWFDFSASATADETCNATTVTRPTDGALMLAAVKQQDFGVNGASTSITATWNKVVESGSTLGSDLGVWAEQTTSVSSVSSITVV